MKKLVSGFKPLTSYTDKEFRQALTSVSEPNLSKI
jgi:hypothetical protein